MDVEGRAVASGSPITQAATANRTAGEVMQAACGLAGIAQATTVSGQKLAVAVEGLFRIRKKQEAISGGDPIYWDENGNPYGETAGEGCATKVRSDGDFRLGVCLEDADATDKEALVLLNESAVPDDPAVLTDNTGGTASASVLVDPGGTYNSATMRNVIATLGSAVNQIRHRLH